MKKKQKTFSTVQEIFETYFPPSENRRRRSFTEDDERSGFDLDKELAKEYQSILQAAASRYGNAKKHSS
jgi:hypothetical protein